MRELEKSNSFYILIKIIPYLWPKNKNSIKFRVILSMVFLILAKITTVATPLFMIWIVDSLIENGSQKEMFVLLGFGSLALVISYGMIRLFTVGFNQLRDAIFALVGQRALRNLALKTFSHIHELSLRFHLERQTGALNRIIDRGVKAVDFLLRFLLFSIFPLFLELIFVGMILIVRYDWGYALLVFCTILIYVWFTLKVTDWRLKFRRRMNARDAEANQKAVDSLINYETVKYFNSEKIERDRYNSSMLDYERAAVQTGVSLAALNFGQSFIITLGLVGVMMLAALGVKDGVLTVGEFVGVNAIMVQLVMPLNFLGTVYREIRQALVDMAEMFDLLDRKFEVKDKTSAVDLKFTEGEISFRNVSFNYNKGDRKILSNLSFSVKTGETIAIVGQSGSGKSTIGRLLFRFYDVCSGKIVINHQDIRNVSQASLRRHIGVIPQDIILFNDTLGYNIAYGNPYSTEKEIKKAASAAKILNFIDSLPDGLNTVVGERGLKLSGGEKQRIGIARTYLKNPKILLLDEATSALDSETEKDILTGLSTISGKKSIIIIISHRLFTVMNADKIIVLDSGRIIEEGTHDQLLKLNKRYARMWTQQLDENPNLIS